MIGGMRAFARSKWALGLFALLIVSFGIFGFQDNFFSGISGNSLMQMGDRRVEIAEINRQVQREIDRVREQENRVLSQEQAYNEGIPQRELGQLQYSKLVLAYADKKDIRASPQAVSNLLLRDTDVLKDELGRVNRNSLQQLANQWGMTIPEYETFVRDELTIGYVQVAAFNAIRTPDVLLDPVVKFLGESRTITFARLANDAISEPPEPTEAQLQTWYDEHKAQFTQPERRRISVLTYSPDDYLDKVEITDEQVKADYDKRIREYSSPETREITEFSSPDRNVLQSFIDLVQQAIPYEDALKRVSGIARADKTVKPADISHGDYGKLVFEMEANKVYPAPLRLDSASPYITVVVRKVTPGIPQPFADVAEQVRRNLAMPDARKQFDASAESFEDAAGGQSLEAIGKQFGVPVIQLAPVDNRARAAGNETNELLALNPEAVGDLFTLKPGDMTQVFEGGNARTMYRLDEVIAEHTLPFADVKGLVRARYLLEEVQKVADKAANDMVAAVKAGRTFEQAAAAAKLTPLPPITTTRQAGAGPQVDPQALALAFNQKIGEVLMVRGSNGEPWVARVDKVEPVSAALAAALKAEVREQAGQSLQRDMQAVFITGLQKEIEMKVDEEGIDRYMKGFLPATEQ